MAAKAGVSTLLRAHNKVAKNTLHTGGLPGQCRLWILEGIRLDFLGQGRSEKGRHTSRRRAEEKGRISLARAGCQFMQSVHPSSGTCTSQCLAFYTTKSAYYTQVAFWLSQCRRMLSSVSIPFSTPCPQLTLKFP
eukprot:1159822-Pelagomonas_calceolata.AAC.6